MRRRAWCGGAAGVSGEVQCSQWLGIGWAWGSSCLGPTPSPSRRALSLPARPAPLSGGHTAGSGGIYDERQRGEINAWARKRDAELIEKLAEKLHVKESRAAQELQTILGTHKLPKEIFDEIVDWKTHH